MGHRPISRRDRDAIASMYRSGMTAVEISACVDRSTHSVYGVLERQGIRRRRGGGQDRGCYLPSQEEIAEETAKIRAGWPDGVQPHELGAWRHKEGLRDARACV